MTREFFRNTLKNLAGFYASLKSLSWRDLTIDRSVKILRFIIFMFALIGLSAYVSEIYVKWKFNPDIMTTEKLISSSEIPMPAMTICSPLLGRVDKGNISDIIKFFEKNDEALKKKLSSNKCIPPMVQRCYPDFSEILRLMIGSKEDENLVDTLDECSLNLYEMFSECFYRNGPVQCEEILNRILTDDGFCYSLNMLGIHEIFNRDTISKDFESYRRTKVVKDFNQNEEGFKKIFDDEKDTKYWSLEGGYKEVGAAFTHPNEAIKRNTFELTMMSNVSDSSNLCADWKKSFKVIFHLPNEMPTPMHMKNFVKLDTTKVFELSAVKFSTDESLRGYPPKVRGCYFDGERKLKFFASYTKTQCEYECFANYTLNKCSCVKFSMPRENTTPVCRLNKTNCVSSTNLFWPPNNDESTCNCLPTCTDIKYNIDYEMTSDYGGQSSNLLFHIYKSPLKSRENVTFSSVVIKFPKNQIRHLERFSAYSWYNFVAECGGLLGFFLGFSVLSTIEIIQRLIKIVLLKCGKNQRQNNILMVAPAQQN